MTTKHPRVALSLSPVVRAQMAAIAEEERRTLSGEVEKACLAWIKQHPLSAESTPPAAGPAA